MRTLLILAAMMVTLGCGGKKDKGPVVVTPEMEAAQKQSEKDVNAEETAMRKQQKSEKTFEQQVDDAERRRR
jgi:predicted small lipoprotein YifL